MKCSIGFNINFDLLHNAKGISNENETKNKERETKEYENQIKVKHINGIEN